MSKRDATPIVVVSTAELLELIAEAELSRGAAEKRGGASPPRLSDLGLSKDDSRRARAVAAVPRCATFAARNRPVAQRMRFFKTCARGQDRPV